MSRELPYFPPKVGKYQWQPKALQHKPWCCNLGMQMGKNHWRENVNLRVDLLEGVYVWSVDTTAFDGKLTTQKGTEDTAVAAITTAERVGEESYNALFPDWVKTALQHGWRPPADG